MSADIFSAIADPTRRKILEFLADLDGCPASDIHKQFSVSPQAISQHLKLLREAELVNVEKKGQQRIYRMNGNTMKEFEEWSKQVRLRWNQRLNALDDVLTQEMKKMKQNND